MRENANRLISLQLRDFVTVVTVVTVHFGVLQNGEKRSILIYINIYTSVS